MNATPPTERPVPYARFRHGRFECTVVSDGVLEMGPARVNFPTASPAEIDELLTTNYLPTENVRLNENILVINTGDKLVQFDSGVGVDPALGRGFFGPKTGQALLNLRAAGIDPADIDIVAITHTHPDHVWGLVDADGVPVYPNATIVVSREDFDYWTDLSRVETAPNEHMKDHFRGAHKNLMPYAEQGRIQWAADGDEIVPGITVLATPGHSPGHVVYLIESDGETMVCWGDLCHHQVLLLQRPDWGFQFDYEQPAATAQRWRVYDIVERNRYAVLAYHFPFPGLGHLKKDGTGYAWLPSELERELPVETKAQVGA
ncbi:MBL fold metallo-hydrolase [Lacisediminihabitans profunda]|uniref:MBL fold metallo-hydrolase n=1 Tax=Lacisediminihabitans profunda TaxID=2594790 RepID=A0A5C8UMA2_9MICO|nr:MBL fold metallo-hydrolase [Lacisediminihabitans profunda]TXN29463.1 MBL fold metallo-hydrolase [Lacisediminihabitans profunda]